MQNPPEPIFHKRIFWDVDFEALDYHKEANFVIERVFTRGDVQDIRNCRHFYGDEKIREALTSAKWLPLRIVYLACAVLDNELTDYRCYSLAKLYPEQYPF